MELQNVLTQLADATAKLEEIAKHQAEVPTWKMGKLTPQIDGIAIVIFNDEYRSVTVKNGECNNSVIGGVWKEIPQRYFVVPLYNELTSGVTFANTSVAFIEPKSVEEKSQSIEETSQVADKRLWNAISLLDADTVARIKDLILKGVSMCEVSRLMGISPTTATKFRNSMILSGELDNAKKREKIALCAIDCIAKDGNSTKGYILNSCKVFTTDWDALKCAVAEALPKVYADGTTESDLVKMIFVIDKSVAVSSATETEPATTETEPATTETEPATTETEPATTETEPHKFLLKDARDAIKVPRGTPKKNKRLVPEYKDDKRFRRSKLSR